MARELVVRVIGDSRQFEKSLQRSTKAATKFEASVSGLGKVAATAGVGFFGAQGVIAGLQQSVEAAVNLNEQISKSREVFGDSSRGLQAWARSASRIGVATDQALE